MAQEESFFHANDVVVHFLFSTSVISPTNQPLPPILASRLSKPWHSPPVRSLEWFASCSGHLWIIIIIVVIITEHYTISVCGDSPLYGGATATAACTLLMTRLPYSANDSTGTAVERVASPNDNWVGNSRKVRVPISGHHTSHKPAEW